MVTVVQFVALTAPPAPLAVSDRPSKARLSTVSVLFVADTDEPVLPVSRLRVARVPLPL